MFKILIWPLQFKQSMLDISHRNCPQRLTGLSNSGILGCFFYSITTSSYIYHFKNHRLTLLGLFLLVCNQFLFEQLTSSVLSSEACLLPEVEEAGEVIVDDNREPAL